MHQVTGTTYTVVTTAGSTVLHQGATTVLTTTVTNTGAAGADTLDYSGLGASSGLGNTVGTPTTGATSGSNLANQNVGTAAYGQTYTATNAGSDTITANGSGTNHTPGTTPTATGGNTGTTITVYTGQGTWTGGSASWGTPTASPSNWTNPGGVPGLAGAPYNNTDSATFGNTGSAVNVSLGGQSPYLNTVTFNNTSTGSYNITPTGGGTLHLNGNTGSPVTAHLTNTAGSNTISAPVEFDTSVAASVANSGDTLTISGAISESGGARSFTVTGPGAVVLNNPTGNTYSGGTIVTATPGATPITGATLYVNNGGGQVGYTAPTSSSNRTITPINSSGSGTGTGSVTVGDGTNANSGTLAGSGTIKSTSGGVTIRNGGTLSSGGIQSGTTAGQGLTINNATGLSSALVVNGGATLTFALGSTVNGSDGSTFNNPNTNSSYLSLTGTTVDQIFSNTSTIDNINLIDLTAGSPTVTLTLRYQNPYLLIQTELGNNADFANLWTTGGQGANGYVLGVSDGTALGYTAFNIQIYDINNNLITTSANYGGLQLYLNNGDLEVVPEPGTWAMMLGGLGVLLFIQSRRRNN